MATNIGKAILAEIAAALAFPGIYFGALSIVSKWDLTVEEILSDRYFVTTLAPGFGVQVVLFMHLRGLVLGVRRQAARGWPSGSIFLLSLAPSSRRT